MTMLRCGLPLAGLLALGACGNPMMMTPTDACRGRVAGDLVISELMIDPDGTDTGGEWIELFNPTSAPIDLRGYTVSYRSGTAAAKSHTVRASVTVPSKGFVALGDVRSGPNPAWLAYSYGDDLGAMSNTSGTVSLRCGMTAINEYTYKRAARSGRSRTLGGPLEPDATRVADEANWCDTPASVEYAPRAAGTPGGPNPVCAPEAMLGTCLQNGAARPIIAAEPGDLVITEVMASPRAVTDTLGEWVELYATTDVDLNGLSLATSTSRATFSSPDCLTVPAQGYSVVARSTDSFVNGGLPKPVATFSVSLSPANERLRLVRGDAGIDDATFFASQVGVSWQLRPELLTNPDDIRPALNDAPESFCRAAAAWMGSAGDFGTPAAPNGPCAVDAGAPSEPDGGLPTFDCNTINPGDLVVTEVMIDPPSTDTGLEWFELFNTTTAPIDLAGLTLTFRQGATAARTHVVRSALVAQPLQAVAVGDVRSGPNPAWIRYSYGADLGAFNNTSGTVGVRCGTKVVAEYTWVRTARSGRSRMLGGPATPTAANAAVEANWCDTPAGNEYTPGSIGTPGATNPVCAAEAMTGTCVDNGVTRPIVAAEPGDLVITEVMASPSVSDTLGEWFEVYATTDVDLNGLSVANANSRTTVSSASCLRLPANTFGILARNSNAFVNGGLPPPVATYGTVSLNSANETLRLFRGDAGVDELSFFASANAKAWQVPGELLTDPTLITPSINDLPAALCVAPNRFQTDGGLGDFGSPTLRNPLCDGGAP
ncbi:MAG: lamin tail domain-containing protein [Myxococcaceae bacterium]|nr:lamin tail domain-containing protein [Myxococcaceae bacterium]